MQMLGCSGTRIPFPLQGREVDHESTEQARLEGFVEGYFHEVARRAVHEFIFVQDALLDVHNPVPGNSEARISRELYIEVDLRIAWRLDGQINRPLDALFLHPTKMSAGDKHHVGGWRPFPIQLHE